jgi:hypothetical protein
MEPESEPLILVPDIQLKNFLALLQGHLPSASLGLEKSDLYWRERNLLVDFPEHPRFTPRFLGISDSRRSYNHLLSQVPGPNSRGANDVVSSPPDEYEEETFSQIIIEVESALDCNESCRARRVRKVERLNTCKRQLKDAQRYLGLCPIAPCEYSQHQSESY